MGKRILFIEPVASYRDISVLEIEAELSWQVVSKKSVQEFFSEELDSEFDLLVLGDLCLLDGGCPRESKEALFKTFEMIPILFFTQYPKEQLGEYLELIERNSRSRYLQKPCSLSRLIQTLKEMTDIVQLPKPKEFCRVAAEKFFNFNTVSCDVYISLSDEKFIKIINANDLYDAETLKKYIEKGVVYFHVRTEDYQNFSTSYYRYLREKMYTIPANLVDKTALEGEIVNNIRERVINLGVDRETITLVDEINQSCLQFAKKNQKLFDLLDALLKQDSFLSSHSLMTAYIATELARMMGLTSEHTHKKLCYAALLHDIFLDDKQCKLSDMPGTKTPIEGDPIWEKIKKHPYEAFELVSENLFIPEDVAAMILCHHEIPDGTGYPRGLTSNAIPALPALFILAEELVLQLQHQGLNALRSDDLKSHFRSKYSVGSFVKPLEIVLKFIDQQK